MRGHLVLQLLQLLLLCREVAAVHLRPSARDAGAQRWGAVGPCLAGTTLRYAWLCCTVCATLRQWASNAAAATAPCAHLGGPPQRGLHLLLRGLYRGPQPHHTPLQVHTQGGQGNGWAWRELSAAVGRTWARGAHSRAALMRGPPGSLPRTSAVLMPTLLAGGPARGVLWLGLCVLRPWDSAYIDLSASSTLRSSSMSLPRGIGNCRRGWQCDAEPPKVTV